jgi:hypothetical protein
MLLLPNVNTILNRLANLNYKHLKKNIKWETKAMREDGKRHEKKCATHLNIKNLYPHDNAHLRIIYIFLPPKLTIF